MKKSTTYSSLPAYLSMSERFALAREAGLDGLQIPSFESQAEAEAAGQAAADNGLEISSVMGGTHWKLPLSSTDEEVREAGVEGIRRALRVAKWAGTDCVLVVPGVVDEDTPYHAAWELAAKSIRELLPLAEELGVIMALENVWNKFLLSPLETRDFIDSFDSPFVQAYFDVGNILLYGYPHHWVEVLGRRIVRVHIKDFDISSRQFVAVLTGDVDFPRVMNALRGVGYDGWLTSELSPYRQFPELFVHETAAHLQAIIDC
ncbi:MAG: sugar phosphate isomerase/epimerase [Armatimonadetes bacterium]|nr:sugar phosphate isomerase/epimerase [Armatimonadota bacterium]